MSEEQQNIEGTTGDADAQIVPAQAPLQPDEREAHDDPVLPTQSTVNREEVTQAMPYPEPHEVAPGYGVTGKFQTDDDGAVRFDAGDPATANEPASETDGLVVEAPAPVTVEQSAAEGDQLDVPADQRGDTA